MPFGAKTLVISFKVLDATIEVSSSLLTFFACYSKYQFQKFKNLSIIYCSTT
jgi:hypothetical protein